MQPRILADDLQVISTGARHLDHFEYAFTKTQEHLEDMGAKVAPHKCYAFSSDRKAREWLKVHRWRRLRRKIKVINHCRDLGAHFNVSEHAQYGSTLTDRPKDAAQITGRLDFSGHPTTKKKKS